MRVPSAEVTCCVLTMSVEAIRPIVDKAVRCALSNSFALLFPRSAGRGLPAGAAYTFRGLRPMIQNRETPHAREPTSCRTSPTLREDAVRGRSRIVVDSCGFPAHFSVGRRPVPDDSCLARACQVPG